MITHTLLILPWLLLQDSRPDVAAEFKNLTREFETAQKAFYAELQKLAKPHGDEAETPDKSATTPAADMSEAYKKNPVRTFLPRFQDIARRAKGTPDAIPSLNWILMSGMQGFDDYAEGRKVARGALDELMTYSADEPALAESAAMLEMSSFVVGGKRAEKAARKWMTSKDRTVKATAIFTLAQMLKGDDDEGMTTQTENGEVISITPDRKQAIELFATLAREFSDLPLGKRAKAIVGTLENLAVGKVAPDFETKDQYGKSFKLSDYRGKVVLIDFWGFW